jgi:hypothetical protein
MSKSFLAVDCHNWYIVSIPPQQLDVTFNIYLLKRIFISTLGIFYGLFDFFAKGTARPAVNDHVGFCFGRRHNPDILINVRL